MKACVKALFLLFMFTLFVNPLYGYIDPGTGSYVLQLLIAGGLAGLYTVKVYWKNIHYFVKTKVLRKK